MTELYQKTRLANGIRIISERMEHAHTVSFGLWLNVGSRDEHDLNNGSAHFVEHMLFKGTAKRSAQQISRQLDVLGGMSNGFTSHENTCFYATVLDRQLPVIVELLADITFNSLFLEEEVDREKHVIIQEISMVDDTPDDLIHDLFSSQLWGRHPLGNTVLGSRRVVGSMTAAKLRDFLQTYYIPENMLISAAGNVNHEELVKLVEGHFGSCSGAVKPAPERTAPQAIPASRKVYTKPIEQAHVVLGSYGLPVTSEQRYIFYLLHVILGGNMSSRLFQEIREKRGLAYSIYSFLSSFLDCGMLGVYLAVDPQSANEAIGLVNQELHKMQQQIPFAEELANAKEFAVGGMYLAAENSEARMNRIARNELVYKRFIPFEEAVDQINAVSCEDILALSRQLLANPMSATIVGPLQKADILWDTVD